MHNTLKSQTENIVGYLHTIGNFMTGIQGAEDFLGQVDGMMDRLHKDFHGNIDDVHTVLNWLEIMSFPSKKEDQVNRSNALALEYCQNKLNAAVKRHEEVTQQLNDIQAAAKAENAKKAEEKAKRAAEPKTTLVLPGAGKPVMLPQQNADTKGEMALTQEKTKLEKEIEKAKAALENAKALPKDQQIPPSLNMMADKIPDTDPRKKQLQESIQAFKEVHANLKVLADAQKNELLKQEQQAVKSNVKGSGGQVKNNASTKETSSSASKLANALKTAFLVFVTFGGYGIYLLASSSKQATNKTKVATPPSQGNIPEPVAKPETKEEKALNTSCDKLNNALGALQVSVADPPQDKKKLDA